MAGGVLLLPLEDARADNPVPDSPATKQAEQVGTTVAWRPGRFEYRRVPLSHVIQDANRYSKRKLVLGDSAAGALLYSGTLFSRDVDEWIVGLERIYPQIEVILTDNARILIRTRVQAPPSE